MKDKFLELWLFIIFLLFSEDHIQNKWTNVRDTFVKTLKTKPGKPRRKYLLYEQLKFLTKIIPEEDLTDYNQDDLHSTFTKEEEKTERERTTKKRSKRSNDDYIPSKLKENEKPSKKLQYEVEIEDFTTKSEDEGSDIDLVEIDENEDPRIMNEDEAFFASLLPTIVKYDEDERLQFRIEVLGVMKRIKDNRKWNKNCEAD